MRKIIFLLLMSFILNLGLSAQEINYPVKTGSVSYTMSMMGTDNLMVMYFNEKGKSQCTDAQMEMFGMKIHNRTIIKGGKTYVLDMAKKSYTESDVTEASLKKNSFFMSDSDITKEGVTKLGEEEILGKTCQIYSITENGAEVKLWVWKGMMLKMESEQQGMSIKIIATEINESAPDQALFEIPSDFTKN